MRLHNVYIENYKGIKRASLCIPDHVCCITGPNNTGKHTLLDALTLVAYLYDDVGGDTPEENKKMFLEQYPDLTGIRYNGATGSIHLCFEFSYEGESHAYSLVISEDYIWDGVNTENEDAKRAFIEFAKRFKLNPFDGYLMEDPCELYTKANEEQRARILESMQKCFPSEKITGIDVVKDHPDRCSWQSRYMAIFKTEYFEQPITLWSFSHTFQNVFSYAVLSEVGEPCTLCLEDPDMNLDVRYMYNLYRLFERYADRTGKQVFIVTHNPYMVDCFMPGNVYISGVSENGGYTYTNAATVDEVMFLWEDCEDEYWYNSYIQIT